MNHFILMILTVCTPLLGSCSEFNAQDGLQRKIVIDTDTGNEIDDFYAIVRALVEPTFEVLALTSAQYHTQADAPESTVVVSQKYNEEILPLMGRSEIPHPMGANNPLTDMHTPRPSAAAQKIIELAHTMPADEKLDVIVLGAMTNPASAILMDSTIVPKIRLHVMGLLYDAETGEWNKNEFNTNNDPHAMDVLLDTRGLELHVMTATASRPLMYYKTNVDAHLKGKGGIWDRLVQRWERYVDIKTWESSIQNAEQWVMWDIAIMEALANPEVAEQKQVATPPENTSRQIYVYTRIDTDAMKQQFWRALHAAMAQN